MQRHKAERVGLAEIDSVVISVAPALLGTDTDGSIQGEPSLQFPAIKA